MLHDRCTRLHFFNPTPRLPITHNAVPALRQGTVSRLPDKGTARQEGQVDGVRRPRLGAAGPGTVRGPAAAEEDGSVGEGEAQGTCAGGFANVAVVISETSITLSAMLDVLAVELLLENRLVFLLAAIYVATGAEI